MRSQLVQAGRHRRRRVAPRQQGQVPRSLRGKPSGQLLAERAEAAGDQIRAVRANDGGAGVRARRGGRRRFGFGFFRLGAAGRVANPDDDLADVLALRHVPERLGRLLRGEFGQRQRPVDALLDLLHHFGEQLANRVRTLAQHAIQVDGEVGEIVLERQQPDHAVLVDVGLADLQEPTVGPQERQALADRVAGQRVEHDVDALPVRRLRGSRRRNRACAS